MKRSFLLLLFPLAVYAQDLQTGNTLSDGVQYHAADFNNMVNNATILPTSVSGKGSGSPVSADLFIFYQNSSTSLRQASLATLFSNSLSFNTRSALTFLAGPGTLGASAANPTWRTITPHDTTVSTDVAVSNNINCLTARTFSRILSANAIYAFQNFVDGETVTVAVKQAASGGPYTSGFTGVVWQAGATPVQTATAGKTDIFTFVKMGGTIFGVASQNF